MSYLVGWLGLVALRVTTVSLGKKNLNEALALWMWQILILEQRHRYWPPAL